jgi:hypothetical protein
MFWVKKNKEILTIGIDNKKSSLSVHDRESDENDESNNTKIYNVLVLMDLGNWNLISMFHDFIFSDRLCFIYIFLVNVLLYLLYHHHNIPYNVDKDMVYNYQDIGNYP